MVNNTAIDHWQTFILTASDDVFFEVMNNYLGDVKTPFNKHELIERLTAFLRRKDTRHRILSLIDDSDAKLLTAVHVLDEPTVSRLFAFLEGELQYLELHYHLLNLESRLLVYREEDKQGARIRLNPLLQRTLLNQVIDTELLFPSVEAACSNDDAPWLNDSLLLSVVALLADCPVVFKTDGDFRKKAATEIKKKFGATGTEKQLIRRFNALLQALEYLGLIVFDGGTANIAPEIWRAFAHRTQVERVCYVCAALWAACSDDEEPDIAGMASGMLCLFDDLPHNRYFAPEALERILRARPDTAVETQGMDEALRSMEELGVFVKKTQSGYRVNAQLAAAAGSPKRTAGVTAASMVLQPNFEVSIQPNAPFEDALTVSMAAELRKHDRVVMMEITRDSYTRALKLGLQPQDIQNAVEALHGEPPPQNCVTMMSSWEREYHSIRLVRGTFLIVDDARQHLIEHSKGIKPTIDEKLAPGIYLLKTGTEDIIDEALRESGVSPVPVIEDAEDTEEGSADEVRGFETLRESEGVTIEAKAHAKREHHPDEQLLETLRKSLEKLNMPDEHRKEMAARISKKLVLFPEQLRNRKTPQEPMEAKGFDYVGKVRLVEQALRSSNELLEVIRRDENGQPTRLLIKPTSLEKKDTDLILIGQALPEEKEVAIRVRKISLLRKLKSSLFAP